MAGTEKIGGDLFYELSIGKGVRKMGYYLNSNMPVTFFEKEKNKRYFVDKSRLLSDLIPLVREGLSYICITRPRRFGKTMIANMVGAFFGKGYDCSDIFDSLEIAADPFYQEHLNQHNVIYIDFSKCNENCRNYQDYITDIKEILREDLHEAFPNVRFREKGTINEDLTRIFNSTGTRFVFVFDEWDSIFHRDYITEADKKSYIEFLAVLLKDQAYVEMAYMTGVLPIAKYTKSSTLNNFLEYTMASQPKYSEYFGFTEEEVDRLFDHYLETEERPEITRQSLKLWYDGYQTARGERLYNPRSVVYALTNNHLASYWTGSGPYLEIADYIRNDIDGVKRDVALMVTGESVKADVQEYAATAMQLNTRDRIYSAMVVYGFLTCCEESHRVRIPNKELMDEFAKTIKEEESLGYVHRLAVESEKILNATLNGDAKTVGDVLAYVHNTESPILNYNNETELAAVVTFAYLAARDQYQVEREDQAGRGYVDFIFYPYDRSKDGIILELKVDHSPEEAIQQIRDRKYALAFQGKLAEGKWNGKRILAVGIAYDSRTGEHRCKIEEVSVGRER